MIIKRNVKIKNRAMLHLAIEQAKRNRDHHYELLSHNAVAVTEKWTLQKVINGIIAKGAPGLLGTVLVYITTLFTSKDENVDFSNWKQILFEFLNNLASRIIQRFA